jgi:hypothetical protein
VTTLSVPISADASASRRSRAQTIARILAGVMIAVSLFARLVYIAKPFDLDSRVFIYLGKLVCDGGRFGHDITDNKFPTVGLITSSFWRVFGTNWPAYVVGQTILIAIGAMLVARMCARHVGQHAAMPAALCAMVLLNFNPAVWGGFQLESLQIFFAILAAGAAMEALTGATAGDAFVVGLAGGCAMMLKPSGGAVMGAFAIAATIKYWRQPRVLFAQAIFAACGVAIPALVTFVYLIRTDILRDMPALYRQIARYAAETPVTWFDWLKPAIVVLLIAIPLAIRFRSSRREENRIDSKPDHSLVILAVAWFILELIGAVAQKRMCAYHFLPLAPPAALLYGMIPSRSRLAVDLVALLPMTIFSVIGAAVVLHNNVGSEMHLQSSDYLVAHTNPGDRIWQDSLCRLLLETDLQPGSRVPLTYLWFNSDTAPQEYSAIMLHDFEVRRPKYILLPTNLGDWLQQTGWESKSEPGLITRHANYREAWRSILNYTRQHYAAETEIDGQTFYRRIDSNSAANSR